MNWCNRDSLVEIVVLEVEKGIRRWVCRRYFVGLAHHAYRMARNPQLPIFWRQLQQQFQKSSLEAGIEVQFWCIDEKDGVVVCSGLDHEIEHEVKSGLLA